MISVPIEAQKKKHDDEVWEWISGSEPKQTPRGKRKAESDRPDEWKFKCRCGETCSSYENPREYPKGRLYECTKCNIWSHVSCVLGDTITDEELAEVADYYPAHGLNSMFSLNVNDRGRIPYAAPALLRIAALAIALPRPRTRPLPRP